MAIERHSFWGYLNYISCAIFACLIFVHIVVFLLITELRRPAPWNWICLSVYTLLLMVFFGSQPKYPDDEYFLFYVSSNWCLFGIAVSLLFIALQACDQLQLLYAAICVVSAGVVFVVTAFFVLGWLCGLAALIAIGPGVCVWMVVVTHVLWMASDDHEFGVEPDEWVFATLSAMVNFVAVLYIWTCACCRKKS